MSGPPRSLLRLAAHKVMEGASGRLVAKMAPGGPGVAVLLYHRILPVRDRDPWSLVVTTDRFREQVDLLASRYPVLPLGEALERIENGTLPARHAVCISFDDGYVDNLVHAAPILVERALPATLFLATAFAERGEPYWWDRIESFLGGAEAAGGPERPRWASDYVALKSMDPDDRDARIAKLAGPARPGPGEARSMSFEEIRKLPGAFTVGGHGHRHVSLGLAGPELARREVGESLAALRREVPRFVPIFAYPFGAPEDEGEAARGVVRDAGFLAAFTTRPGVVRKGADWFSLPRVTALDEPAGALALRLVKLFSTS